MSGPRSRSESGPRLPRAPAPDVARTAAGASPPWRALAASIAIFAVLVGGFAAWRATQSATARPRHPHQSERSAARMATHGGRGHASPPRCCWGRCKGPVREGLRVVGTPDSGGAPVSLGVMPTSGQIDRELTEAQRAALLGASKVAVSLEPTGGSPSGAPTGPVLFVADKARRA